MAVSKSRGEFERGMKERRRGADRKGKESV
jgi:hypothetical protein